MWWDNSHARFLGWHPKDNAERFRAGLERTALRPAPDSALAVYQGGAFVDEPIHQDD
ncbi:hypothetical protein D3C80_2222940 [compost metagenome]